MGKRLNALLGRSSKASKLNKVADLAVSRIAILRNLHRVRCSQALSDVIQLLHQGYWQRALVRVEQVIEEQNALDALAMMESYCHLLGERSELITHSREWGCPAELKEAASTLIFAASRTGEFPELHEIRRMLTSRYGKDFAYSAVELRNDSTVYPKMALRLLRERPSMETRQSLVMQIAKENGIALQLGQEQLHISKNRKLQEQLQMHDEDEQLDNDHETREQFSESVEATKGYRDEAAGAREALEPAAVELSRKEAWDESGDSHHQYTSQISKTQMREAEGQNSSSGLNLPTFDDSGSDDEEITQNRYRYSVEKIDKLQESDIIGYYRFSCAS